MIWSARSNSASGPFDDPVTAEPRLCGTIGGMKLRSTCAGFGAVALIGSLVMMVGCGDGGDGGGGGSGGMGVLPVVMVDPAMKYMPLKTGVEWTYRVRDVSSNVVSTKKTTVGALEAVPAPGKMTVMAYKVTTTKGTQLNDKTESWQEDRGSLTIRHLERSFRPGINVADLEEWWEPFKVRLEEHPDRLKTGTKWTVTYKETHKPAIGGTTTQDRMEEWTVVSASEAVTVPAGTFMNALRVRRRGVDFGATSDKEYWYVRGLGKVKETGGQLEELVSVVGLAVPGQ